MERQEGAPRVIDGRYRLERRLGRGGMGEVYRATHLVLERACAVKLLKGKRRLDPHSLDRFRSEAEALATLEHPNVVRITDFGVDEKTRAPFLVMELLEGRTLRRALRDDGPLSLDRAGAILTQLAEALEFSHDRGIVHGDLKPENVFLVEDEGGQPLVKLLDLGLACFLADSEGAEKREINEPSPLRRRVFEADGDEDRPTEAVPQVDGAGAGTPGYMAPEVTAGGPSNPESDRFAFAVVAYELICGRRPFGRQEDGEARDPERPTFVRPELPVEIDDVLLDVLRAPPVERPRTGELAAQLVSLARRRADARWRRAERPRRLALVVAIAVIAAAAGWLVDRSELLAGLERRLIDLRFALAPARAPDPRLLVVEIDDASLAADARPLAERGDEVGRVLSGALDAGGAGVGIDILLPLQWGQSRGFVELVIGHPDRVVLAALSARGGAVGHEVADGLITVALGRDAVERLFGFTNVEPDPDGVIRHAHLVLSDAEGRRHPSFAARLAAMEAPLTMDDHRRLIDFRVDLEQVERVNFEGLAERVELSPEWLEGRLLIFGQTYVGAGDIHRVAPRAGRAGDQMSGLDVQLVICDTLLDGNSLRHVGPLGIIKLIALFGISSGWVVLWQRSVRWGVLIYGAGLAAVVVGAFGAFSWFDRCLPMVGPMIGLALGCVACVVARLLLPARPHIGLKEDQYA